MTTDELALALKSIKVVPHTAQLNPNRYLPPGKFPLKRQLPNQTHVSIAAGRVLVEFGGRSKVIAPSLKKPVSIRRILMKLINPSFTLIENKGAARKAMEELLQCINVEATKSLALADILALQNKVSKAEQKARDRKEKAFIELSRTELTTVLNKYARVLDEDIILGMWKEAVIRSVLND